MYCIDVLVCLTNKRNILLPLKRRKEERKGGRERERERREKGESKREYWGRNLPLVVA